MLYEQDNFEAFWLEYEAIHADPTTRRVHAIGTFLCGLMIITGLVTGLWGLLLLGPLIDYGLAQVSHRAKGQRTQPYRNPVWHVRAELRLFRGTIAGLFSIRST